MNLPKLTPLCALLLCVACDPDSQSLGEEPSETASGEGSGGDPVSAEAELLGEYVGAGIQHIDIRADGFVAAGGVGGYQGTFGDLALFDGDPFEYTTHCMGVVIEGRLGSHELR